MTRRVTMSPMAVNVDRVDIPVRKVLIGSIAVDSATLVIADPSYLDRQWIKGGDVEPYALNCLGKDVEPLVTALRSLPVTGQVESMPGGRWYRVLPAEGYTARDLLAHGKTLQAAHGWVGAAIPVSHDSMERVVTAVRDRIGAVIDFSRGNPGFMAAMSLPGDGSYEVYAIVEDLPAGPELKAIQVEIAPTTLQAGS